MARAQFIKSARKDYPEIGVKKGESYWRWSLNVGGRFVQRMSKTQPRRSQLTNSEFIAAMCDAEDNLQQAFAKFAQDDEAETCDLLAEIESVKSEVEQAREVCEEKQTNLEQAFPGGCPNLELMESRIAACNDIEDQLDSLVNDIEAEEQDEDEDDQSFRERILDMEQNVNWDYE